MRIQLLALLALIGLAACAAPADPARAAAARCMSQPVGMCGPGRADARTVLISDLDTASRAPVSTSTGVPWE